jgi:hypothetical protein
MPIAREGEFLVTRTMGDTPHIGLESKVLPACIAEARRARYRGVFGSPYFGFDERTLNALHDLPDLESIWFWDVALKDVQAVYGLKSLRALGVHPRRPPMEFSRLPSLRHLVLHPLSKDSGLETLYLLESLHLWHFSPKSKSFHDLALPTKISERQINWANPKDLAGLAPNPNLRRLEIHRCRNLETLSGLPDLFPSLEHLVVAACGKLDGAREAHLAPHLPILKHAYIQNRKVV